ncbi:hypothetical protein Fmac_032802 [Flemingia macrophylla]|uniref:Uncharacterized protein n=1 Tax=Flemingia macrophylla TaxID=520843 RepID=A0ABD1L5X8_9FABA
MSILRLMLQTPIAGHHNNIDKALDKEDGSNLLASAASVHTMTTILVSVILRSNLEWMSILRLMLQTSIEGHHSSRDKALDKEDVSQLLKVGRQASCSCELGDSVAANKKPASVPRVSGLRSSNDHYTSVSPSSQQSGMDEHPEAYAANTYSRPPQQGVHDVATDTSAETRKLKGKLYALMNLVTQIAANQKLASIARVCGIRSSNDHHTRGHHSSRDNALDREDGSQLLAIQCRNHATFIRGVHDVATDTFAETRKLEGKLDALVNLVTQLAANQNPASVARVCGLHSSNDHYISVCPSLQQSGVDDHPEAYSTNTCINDPIVIRGVHDVATDTSAETRKLEGKLDALVNLVTQIAANQKPASVPRVCGIRSYNDHHSSVCPSSQQSGVDEHPEAYAANTYSRGVHDVSTDTSVETRELEGKLVALVNLVTQLAANQKPASVERVCGLCSSIDHHTSFSSRNQSTVIRGVHDVATDTSAETGKLEGKLVDLVKLVTQLAANPKPASVERFCGLRSSNDHHTSVCPSSQQSGVHEHPEAYAANTYSRPP